MSDTPAKYRLEHYPQVPCKPFIVDSDDLGYLVKLKETLALQHLFLFDNKMIPDYSNAILISMLAPTDEQSDDHYWNLDDDEIEEILTTGTAEPATTDTLVTETVTYRLSVPDNLISQSEQDNDPDIISNYVADCTSHNIGVQTVIDRTIETA